VMEHSKRLACVPFKGAWRDLGSWSSLWEAGEKDRSGNVAVGDVFLHDVRNSYVHGSSRLVALTGVEGLVVVDTDDALLVCAMDQAQSIAQVASELARAERSEARVHRKVRRPWGMYESLKEGEQYRVKHLVVDVAGCLSLQYHRYRSEHWVVVSGTARVRIGDRDFIMKANDSAYIPIGTVHRLENAGDEELQLIEVQCGHRLLEDDIVRLDDRYGRYSVA
jgi:mannose-1-phosphate guanylyltransferase/mannose-6-phosphate isomerase